MYMSLGYSPDLFWRSTFKEVHLHILAFHRKVEFERKSMKWQIWHQAVLQRTSKFPTLKVFMDESDTPKKKTAKQINDLVKNLYLGLGGNPDKWQAANSNGKPEVIRIGNATKRRRSKKGADRLR